jgi:DNA-binding NarL/FixJ family response regulator
VKKEPEMLATTVSTSPFERETSDRLTPREQEVLVLIAEGLSTKEIAARLGISFKTAACHRYRLMEKLSIHDSVSLARYAIRNGLIVA